MFKARLRLIIWALGAVFLIGCNSYKSNVLENHTFKIIKVNNYKLPSANTEIRAQFINGTVFLLGTCNPTTATYSLQDNLITIDAFGHLKQNFCTELVHLPNGTLQERGSSRPSSRTENEFIRIGKDTFQVLEIGKRIHFVDHAKNNVVILER